LKLMLDEDETKLSESTTCMRYVDPMLNQVGWIPDLIVREYHINNGKIVPAGRGGKRNDPVIADYVLQPAPNYKLATVEAKAYDLEHDLGMQQSIRYADKMHAPFAYATNGRKIEEYDFITKKQTTIDKFPTPEKLSLH